MQTADALHFLHSLGIVHTDFKPGNIMVDTRLRRVVIVDFNAYERPKEEGWKPSRGTHTAYPYRAPELWQSWRVQRRMSAHRACTCAVDIWSYGVTCVETVRHGQSLFGSLGSEQNTHQRIFEFASSKNALDLMVTTLPDSVLPLSGIRNIVRCAMQIDPRIRQLKTSGAG